ncbi:MAG: Crp/Fnr family transcriptional regulator [Lautropia sp.]
MSLLDTSAPFADTAFAGGVHLEPAAGPDRFTAAEPPLATRIGEQMALLARRVPISRRIVHAGDRIYHAVDAFERLHVVNAGLCKTVQISADGREQVAALHFRGDWMGIGGIAAGRYGCDAIAMDTGEIWSVRYDDLLAACCRTPTLLAFVHEAMSRELLRERAAMLALCTLPADARVAEFLRWWADALEQRGLRADSVKLPMTRAEIGNFLGMTLESVSRALCKLARRDVIRFAAGGRRDIEIPAPGALSAFVAQSLAPLH